MTLELHPLERNLAILSLSFMIVGLSIYIVGSFDFSKPLIVVGMIFLGTSFGMMISIYFFKRQLHKFGSVNEN